MKETEIAWLAGIIEGEGNFGVCDNKSKRFRIRVRMTDEDIINRVSCLFQNKYHQIKKVKDGCKPVFEVSVSGKNALKIYKLIEPYMGIRRRNKVQSILEQK